MAEQSPAARLTVVTLGVADMKRSIAFYEGYGRRRRIAAELRALIEAGLRERRMAVDR